MMQSHHQFPWESFTVALQNYNDQGHQSSQEALVRLGFEMTSTGFDKSSYPKLAFLVIDLFYPHYQKLGHNKI